MRSHLSSSKRIVALLLLGILVSATFAGASAAAPQIWIVKANVGEDTTLAGETTPVNVHVKNSGSGGGITVDVKANGSTVASEWVQIDGNSEKNVEIPISFDEPGNYEIDVGSNNVDAGILTVTEIKTTSVENRNDGRTVLVQTGAVADGTSLTAEFPDAENQSFTVDSVTMTGTSSGYNRSVATYSPPADAPFSVPTDASASVIGAVDLDSIQDVETTSLALSIDRETVRDNGLQTDEVVVYGHDDGTYVPLATSQAATNADAIVYEVDTDGYDQFVVGSLSADFAVESTRLSTNGVDEGQRINLTATVSNDGSIEGEYVAEMVVDGSTVDEQTVSIPAGERETVTLHHVVTERGDYEVALGGQSAGSVVVTGDDVSSDDSANDENNSGSPGESAESPSDSTGQSDAGLALPSIDEIGVLELGIGAGVVLLGGGLLLVLRR